MLQALLGLLRVLADAVVALWAVLYTIGRAFWVCRAPAFSILIGLLLIVKTDQARDIVLSTYDPAHGTGPYRRALVAVVIWAFIAWYWARVTADDVDARPAPLGGGWRTRWNNFCLEHMPRLVGAGAFLAFGWAFCTAARIYRDLGTDTGIDARIAETDAHNVAGYFTAATVYAVFAIVFYALVWMRKPILNYVANRLPQNSLLERSLRPDPPGTTNTFKDLATNPITAGFLGLSLLAAPVASLLIAGDPIRWTDENHLRGAVPAVLIGLALMVPIFNLLVLLAARTSFPFYGLAIVGLMWAPWITGSFHDVRTCRSLGDAAKEGCPSQLADRADLTATFYQWWKANAGAGMTKPIGDSGVVVPPMVMVATEGGASRAAYWTSQILGRIADTEPHFADRVFMVSGVSGGSLGATLFRSLVEADRRAPGKPGTAPHFAAQADQFMRNDFLGPALAAGLYVDFPMRLGVDHVLPGRFEDRAVALEKAWEHAWDGLGNRPFTWRDGFVTSLAGSADGARPPWPILALNGTSVEKGKRIVTSTVHFTRNMSGNVNRYDAFDIIRSDMPISTAVTMSARFPVISPTGALKLPNGRVDARVTDGGLFENFGAFTADEVLRHLTSRLATSQEGNNQTAPIAILISSDPSLDPLNMRNFHTPAPPDCDDVEKYGKKKIRPVDETQYGNGEHECPAEVLPYDRTLINPALALYDGRVARGEAAATALRDRVRELQIQVRDRLVAQKGLDIEEVRYRLGWDDNVDFFHFRMCRLPGVRAPTMSWHHSTTAVEAMERMLDLDPKRTGVGADPCGNRTEFFRLCVRLARITGAAADDQVATDQCAARWPKPEGWHCEPHPDAPAKWRRPVCGPQQVARNL